MWDKVFRDEKALVLHEKIHSGEKHFQCSICDKAFTYSACLSRHMNTHSGDKPFKYWQAMCRQTLEINHSNVINVINKSYSVMIYYAIWGNIQGKNLFNVANVKCFLSKILILQVIWKCILERNPSNVINMWESFHTVCWSIMSYDNTLQIRYLNTGKPYVDTLWR